MKLGSQVKTGETKYKTRNQMQIFRMIKCIKDFKVTLHTHLAHRFIIVRL